MKTLVHLVVGYLILPAFQFLADIINGFVSAILLVVVKFLDYTVLSPTSPNGVIYHILSVGYAELALFAGMIMLAALLWESIQIQQKVLLGVGPEDSPGQLLGRAVWSALMLLAGLVFIHVLILINNGIVNLFHVTFEDVLRSLNVVNPFATKHHGIETRHGIESLFGGAITVYGFYVILYLFAPFVGAAVAAMALWAILTWFARQFELIFWGTVLPVGIALSVADPQRRIWEFMKQQLVGIIFQQGIQAFALWLVFFIAQDIQNGNTYGGFSFFFSEIFMAVGFYYVSRAPKYWQQLYGHVATGGTEVGAIAAGNIMARVGESAFQASRGGQILGAAMTAHGAQSQHSLIEGANEPHSGTRAAISNAAAPVMERMQRSSFAQWVGDHTESGGAKGMVAQTLAKAGDGVKHLGSLAGAALDVAANPGQATRGMAGRAYVGATVDQELHQADTQAQMTRIQHAAGVDAAKLRAEAAQSSARMTTLADHPHDRNLIQTARSAEQQPGDPSFGMDGPRQPTRPGGGSDSPSAPPAAPPPPSGPAPTPNSAVRADNPPGFHQDAGSGLFVPTSVGTVGTMGSSPHSGMSGSPGSAGMSGASGRPGMPGGDGMPGAPGNAGASGQPGSAGPGGPTSPSARPSMPSSTPVGDGQDFPIPDPALAMESPPEPQPATMERDPAAPGQGEGHDPRVSALVSQVAGLQTDVSGMHTDVNSVRSHQQMGASPSGTSTRIDHAMFSTMAVTEGNARQVGDANVQHSETLESQTAAHTLNQQAAMAREDPSAFSDAVATQMHYPDAQALADDPKAGDRLRAHVLGSDGLRPYRVAAGEADPGIPVPPDDPSAALPGEAQGGISPTLRNTLATIRRNAPG